MAEEWTRKKNFIFLNAKKIGLLYSREFECKRRRSHFFSRIRRRRDSRRFFLRQLLIIFVIRVIRTHAQQNFPWIKIEDEEAHGSSSKPKQRISLHLLLLSPKGMRRHPHMAREVLALPKVRNTCPIWLLNSDAKWYILFSLNCLFSL